MSDEDINPLQFLGFEALLWVVIVFLGSWGYAISEYGWFIGVSLGWIPSAILALMVLGLAWLGYVYIPNEAPSLHYVSIAIAIIFGVASLSLVLGGGFLVIKLFQ